jgi:hypothetical protein
MVEYYALLYVNGKMRPVATIPRMGGGRTIMVGAFNYDLL